MSKQLAISSAFSIFAMVALVLFAAPGEMATGAKANASAPAMVQQAAYSLPLLSD